MPVNASFRLFDIMPPQIFIMYNLLRIDLNSSLPKTIHCPVLP